jgi:DNA-binding beta-propeller fold protein YncE
MPADLTADPSGTTFLVSSSGNNGVYRINIASGMETLLFNVGMRPDGLAYDSAGELFAVLNESQIAQINPATGAIIKTLALPTPAGATTPQADGLTFDAATGFLYVASDDGGVYQVNTALTSQTYQQILTPANTLTTEFDGIASTGNTLYIINRDQAGIQYLLGAGGSVAGGTLTETSPFDSGADDIAPATFGSLVSSPEPGSFLLIGAGLLLIGVGGRRVSQFTGPRA